MEKTPKSALDVTAEVPTLLSAVAIGLSAVFSAGVVDFARRSDSSSSITVVSIKVLCH